MPVTKPNAAVKNSKVTQNFQAANTSSFYKHVIYPDLAEAKYPVKMSDAIFFHFAYFTICLNKNFIQTISNTYIPSPTETKILPLYHILDNDMRKTAT